jgi:hypothetical protein
MRFIAALLALGVKFFNGILRVFLFVPVLLDVGAL